MGKRQKLTHDVASGEVQPNRQLKRTIGGMHSSWTSLHPFLRPMIIMIVTPFQCAENSWSWKIPLSQIQTSLHRPGKTWVNQYTPPSKKSELVLCIPPGLHVMLVLQQSVKLLYLDQVFWHLPIQKAAISFRARRHKSNIADLLYTWHKCCTRKI